MVVAVPCFSGAGWDVTSLGGLDGFDVRAPRLPDGPVDIEAAADAVLQVVPVGREFVVAGDSFGAAVALVVALRRPRSLAGLVLSGGFAADPTPWWKSTAAAMSGWLPRVVYRQVVLRFHAGQLRSGFDRAAEVPHLPADYRRLFLVHTPKASYAARLRAVRAFDLRDRLGEVEVPVLVLTPADDRLVGPVATRALIEGLPDVREVILPATGHMFRFTHPTRYSQAIGGFVRSLQPAAEPR